MPEETTPEPDATEAREPGCLYNALVAFVAVAAAATCYVAMQHHLDYKAPTKQDTEQIAPGNLEKKAMDPHGEMIFKDE